MESESVLIVATLFIFINAGFIGCAELFRDPSSDNGQRDFISRVICPTCLVISITAMIGAQRRNSFLLLPFLITLVLFLVFMCGLAVYLIAWCPFDNSGDNFVCSIAVVLGAVCFAGALLMSCLYYVVYSLYKFIRNGGVDDDDDDLNNVTDIELLDRTHKDMLDHDQYHDYDHDQPSTSYN